MSALEATTDEDKSDVQTTSVDQQPISSQARTWIIELKSQKRRLVELEEEVEDAKNRLDERRKRYNEQLSTFEEQLLRL